MMVTSKHGSSSFSQTATLTGSHQFKINDYSLIKEMALDTCVRSAIFTAVGYDWIIRYYPKKCYTTNIYYIGLMLELRGEAKNVTVGIEFALDTEITKNKKSRKITHVFNGSESTGGFMHFMERSSVDSGGYVKGDCLKVECIITIWKPSRLLSSIAIPPPNLSKQFGSVLLNEEGTDVTFEVDGKTFSAHKLVLAVRSPVFKAQFFGEMKETKSQIPVLEMEAPIFKAMLRFIYTDSLPEKSEIIKDYSGGGDDGTAIFQHLLVAADRYGLERLKIFCEKVLFTGIDETNAVAILAFSEQHNCTQLKNACLDFIATPKTIKAITMAREFEHLFRACPSTLKDLIEKFGLLN